jgi:hypothetical protein
MPRPAISIVGLAALLAMTLSPALAAQIRVIPPKDNGDIAVVVVTGDLAYGDDETFRHVTAGLSTAIVAFESEGGNLIAGIGIGRHIRGRGFASIVPEGGRCASACAIAWLGGTPTIMAEHSLIGFHSAYDAHDNSTSGPDNAFIGAYLNELGLSLDAIGYLTSAKPDDMTWLTYADATARGLDIRYLPDNSRELADAPALPAPAPPQQIADWTALGSWIQIYSRTSAAEAVELAKPYANTMGNARVFQNVNGWYTVILGPYQPQEARHRVGALQASGEIPSDSFVVSGRRFDRLVWGEQPTASITITPASTSSATRAAQEFFEMGSAPRNEALAYLREVYPETVDYYGKVLSRREVLNDKETFLRHWPERQYAVDPATVRSNCDERGACIVEGIVGWQARHPRERRLSEGKAMFVLRFDLSGRTRLLEERTEILERERRRY